jgi:hypothetical protein
MVAGRPCRTANLPLPANVHAWFAIASDRTRLASRDGRRRSTILHKCRDAVTHQIVAGQAAGHRADGARAIMSQEITQCVMQGRHLALVDHLLGEIAEVAVQMGHFEDAICLLTAFEHAERLGGADDGVGSDPSRHALRLR